MSHIYLATQVWVSGGRRGELLITCNKSSCIYISPCSPGLCLYIYLPVALGYA